MYYTERAIAKEVVDVLLGSATPLFDQLLTEAEVLASLYSRIHANTHSAIRASGSSSTPVTVSPLILPTAIFAPSLLSRQVEVSTGLKASALHGMLRWFAMLASRMYLCRLWSSTHLHPSHSSVQNTTFMDCMELASIQSSVTELLESTEQELCILDARIAGKATLFEREHPLLSQYLGNTTGNVPSSSSIAQSTTVLFIYQKTRRWESFFDSIAKKIVMFCQLLQSQHESTSSSSSNTMVKKLDVLTPQQSQQVANLEDEIKFYYTFANLHDLENFVKQSHRVEVCSTALTSKHVPSEQSLRLDLSSLDNHALLSFSRKVFSTYLQQVLMKLFKRIWTPLQQAINVYGMIKKKREDAKLQQDRQSKFLFSLLLCSPLKIIHFCCSFSFSIARIDCYSWQRKCAQAFLTNIVY